MILEKEKKEINDLIFEIGELISLKEKGDGNVNPEDDTVSAFMDPKIQAEPIQPSISAHTFRELKIKKKEVDGIIDEWDKFKIKQKSIDQRADVSYYRNRLNDLKTQIENI